MICCKSQVALGAWLTFSSRWSNRGHFVLTLAKAAFEIRTRITPLTLHSGVAAQSWVPLKLNPGASAFPVACYGVSERLE